MVWLAVASFSSAEQFFLPRLVLTQIYFALVHSSLHTELYKLEHDILHLPSKITNPSKQSTKNCKWCPFP